MPKLTLFIDDGDVMSDNARRGAQWQRLLGEFFPPILGGIPEAWAEANRLASPPLWQEKCVQAMWDEAKANYAAYWRAYQLAWLKGMCQLVRVSTPSEEESLALARRAADYVTRRVRATFPGVIGAIRTLHTRGYRLHTASGEPSTDLHGYLEGMGLRHCFDRLYGPDLVNLLKASPEFFERIFADAGVVPAEALVIDNNPIVLNWATQAGAKTALVGSADGKRQPELILASLAELPQVVETLEA